MTNRKRTTDAIRKTDILLNDVWEAIHCHISQHGESESLKRVENFLDNAVPSLLNDSGEGVPVLREAEPFFILCGRDPVAAPLIEAWAYLRTGHVVMAQRSLEQVISAASHMEPQGSGDPQILSAFRIARDCRDYQREIALGTGRASTSKE